MTLPLHSRLRNCLQTLRSAELKPEERLKKERTLLELLQQLVDGKIRHALSGAEDLQALAKIVLDPELVQTGTAALLLDQFRYRLAHVAMRCRDWLLAERLLEAALSGPAPLRLARLYLALCTAQLRQAPLDTNALQELVRALVSDLPVDGGAPLDLAVQDPVTNMAELFLLLQNAPEGILDALYEPLPQGSQQRRPTSGLTVLLQPLEGPFSEVLLPEWLALRQLEDLQASGWLVVDATARLGELGRGTPVGHPRSDLNRDAMTACLQILGMKAPQSLSLRDMKPLFFEGAGPELIGTPGTESDRGPTSLVPLPLERATTGIRLDTRERVIDNANQRWTLWRPYAVIRSDCSRAWSHSLPSPQ